MDSKIHPQRALEISARLCYNVPMNGEHIFLSYQFAAFIAGTFILYYIVPKRLQQWLLLLASLGFYFCAGWTYPIYIITTATAVYMAGYYMGSQDEIYDRMSKRASKEQQRMLKKEFTSKKKTVMLLCLIFNLGILAVTKYSAFFITNINSFLSDKNEISVPDLIVPLGISFYTLQAIGYLLDVYWGRCKVQKNYPKLLLFVTFFPQLILGPISRYSDLSKTLYRKHYFDRIMVGQGLQRILWGCFKIMVVADRLSPAVTELISGADNYTGGYVFILMIFWAIVLYADFTGSIDIAIGIALIFGIRVEENFARPYFSKSVFEYWQRWHITMSKWFRDYVFYPFGTSRTLRKLTIVSKKRFGMKFAKRVSVYTSTIVCWIAIGIWCGAGWRFVLWGLANGIIILISAELEPVYEGFRKNHPALITSLGYKLFRIGRTFLLMCAIRMIYVYDSAKLSFKQFFRMFTDVFACPVEGEKLLGMGVSATDYIVVAFGVFLMVIISLCGRKQRVSRRLMHTPYVVRYMLLLLLFLTTVMLGKYGLAVDPARFVSE